MNLNKKNLISLINIGIKENDLKPEILIKRFISKNGQHKTLENFDNIQSCWEKSNAEFNPTEWEHLKNNLEYKKTKRIRMSNNIQQWTENKIDLIEKPFDTILISILLGFLPAIIFGYIFTKRTYYKLYKNVRIETNEAKSNFYLDEFNYILAITIFVVIFITSYLYIKSKITTANSV